MKLIKTKFLLKTYLFDIWKICVDLVHSFSLNKPKCIVAVSKYCCLEVQLFSFGIMHKLHE